MCCQMFGVEEHNVLFCAQKHTRSSCLEHLLACMFADDQETGAQSSSENVNFVCISKRNFFSQHFDHIGQFLILHF